MQDMQAFVSGFMHTPLCRSAILQCRYATRHAHRMQDWHEQSNRIAFNIERLQSQAANWAEVGAAARVCQRQHPGVLCLQTAVLC